MSQLPTVLTENRCLSPTLNNELIAEYMTTCEARLKNVMVNPLPERLYIEVDAGILGSFSKVVTVSEWLSLQ
uniref:Phage protein n=1 Tax=Heterorhabditis bacteriophora TaxID=37862 RepID=A0A1I7WWX8_HETBA